LVFKRLLCDRRCFGMARACFDDIGGGVLRDRLPPDRVRWADLRDSSTESLQVPAAGGPVCDSQASYRGLSTDSLDGMHHKLEAAVTLGSSAGAGAISNAAAPRGVAIHEADPVCGEASGASTDGCSAHQGDPSGASVDRATAGTAVSEQVSKLNASAPEFIPTLSGGGAWLQLPVQGSSAAEATTMPGFELARGAGHGVVPVALPEAQKSPAVSTRRRITQKRRWTASEAVAPQPVMPAPTASSTPSGKRLRAEEEAFEVSLPIAEQESALASEMAPATEEDWQRRTDKRSLAVATIKASPEYQLYVSNRDHETISVPAPVTPDPDDRSVSKRSWEAGVMRWRSTLRQWAAAARGTVASAPPAD